MTPRRDFWQHVARGDAGTCWPWRGPVTNRGYGRAGGGRLAHRVAFELTHGPIPAGAHILHSCDWPLCCNPAHLSAGTRSDNMRDCVAKGRHNPRRGASKPAAKLTDAAVRELRALRADGWTYRALAARYGVNHQTAWNAANGRKWAHVR